MFLRFHSFSQVVKWPEWKRTFWIICLEGSGPPLINTQKLKKNSMAGMRIAFGAAAGERLQCSGVYQCVASNNVCLLTVTAWHFCVCARPRVRVRSVVRVQRLTQCIAQLVSLSRCCICGSDRQQLNGLRIPPISTHTNIPCISPHPALAV